MSIKQKVKIIYNRINEGDRPKPVIGSAGYHIDKNVKRIKLKPKDK